MSRTRPLTPPDEMQTIWDEPKGDRYVPNLRRHFPDPDEDYIDEDHDIEMTFVTDQKRREEG